MTHFTLSISCQSNPDFRLSNQYQYQLTGLYSRWILWDIGKSNQKTKLTSTTSEFVPITNIGKMIGSSCTIIGLFCISFPIPVIVSHFAYLYNRDKEGRNARALDLIDHVHGKLDLWQNSLLEIKLKKTIKMDTSNEAQKLMK